MTIEVDPLRPEREIVTAITGAYLSSDSGQTWKRPNDLPDGDFRTAHFNLNGTLIISGAGVTFLTNPYPRSCLPHLTSSICLVAKIGKARPTSEFARGPRRRELLA